MPIVSCDYIQPHVSCLSSERIAQWTRFLHISFQLFGMAGSAMEGRRICEREVADSLLDLDADA